MKKIFSIVFSLLLLVGCTQVEIQSTLMNDVPEMPKWDMLVQYDTDAYVFVEMKGVHADDFEAYVDACVQAGFDRDMKRNENYFYAFNADAQRIIMIYDDMKQDCSFECYESKINRPLEWKETDLLPTPDCENGVVEKFDDKTIEAYLNMNTDQFDDYIMECKKLGFKSYSNKDTYYYGVSKDGYDLYLIYLGADTVSLTLALK